MNKCLLCKSNFKRQIDYGIIPSFVKPREGYACSNCLQGFVKKKGIVCLNCNKEVNKKGLCSDCIKWQQKYTDSILGNEAIYQHSEAFHDLMMQYKRYGDYALSYILAELVNSLPKADYYAPTPSSPGHLRKRGFEITVPIYQKFVPLTDLLVKADTKKTQGEGNRQERLLTKQTFPTIRSKNVRGKISLLDDIYITERILYYARDTVLEAYPSCKIDSFTIQQVSDQ